MGLVVALLWSCLPFFVDCSVVGWDGAGVMDRCVFFSCGHIIRASRIRVFMPHIRVLRVHVSATLSLEAPYSLLVSASCFLLYKLSYLLILVSIAE